MQVKDVMTADPTCCTGQDRLQRAAQLMVECDCGEIPVVDDENKPVGVITDRDITCRAVAKGLDTQSLSVSDVMTTPVICVRPNDSLEECCRLMEQKQIRRVPVVDENGTCCGIVSLADLARNTSKADSGEVLRDVSEKTMHASNVA